MAKVKYVVDLTTEEREQLQGVIRRGKRSARVVTRARILLKAHQGLSDEAVAEMLGVGSATVGRIRQRFVEQGLEAALHDRPRPGARRKLSDREEAHLIAIACSDAPAGHTHWTLQLLADKAVELGYVESIAEETIRRRLKKTP